MEINEKGKTIVLSAKDKKYLKSIYALGFEPKDAIDILYQAIVVICKQQGVDPTIQMMHLFLGTAEEEDNNES